MTTQEAYQRVAEILDDTKVKMEEVWKLTREHGLLVGVRDRNATPEVLDPKFYVITPRTVKNYQQEDVTYFDRQIRKYLTEEEIVELAKAFDNDVEWVREYVLGTDPYEHWVPSQFC